MAGQRLSWPPHREKLRELVASVCEEAGERLQIADGRRLVEAWSAVGDQVDILAEAAGITAGSWYASPTTDVGYELIGAAMLILIRGGRGFPLDYGEVERWPRVGYERGMRSLKGER